LYSHFCSHFFSALDNFKKVTLQFPSTADSRVGRRLPPEGNFFRDIIDLKGRRGLPGLFDNHIHFIRGGLTFNRELQLERLNVRARIGDDWSKVAR